MSKPQKLRYIVLSDLHLGESDSLFTPIKGESYKLVDAFSECLADLIHHFNVKELPSLIFNGDILGLSFSSYADSLQAFEHFVHAFTKEHKICDQVAYLPGNHDHHIWQLAQEEKYQALLADRTKGEAIPELPTATSALYEEGWSSAFFEAFMGPGTSSPNQLKVLYPNMILSPPQTGDPFILLHHGHFAESTYHFVSQAMQALYPDLSVPKNLGELEKENGAFINFVFSRLGRSGNAGIHFETLMATLSSKELLQERIDELADNLAHAVDFPYIPFHLMERMLAKTLISNIADKVRSERYKADSVCSQSTMDNLLDYVDNYCTDVLRKHAWNQEPTTLIWSHTHKPFEKIVDTQQFERLRVINTGGWVIPHQPISAIGGSILLINDRNEVQALRIYNDGPQGGQMQFAISLPEGEKESAFAQKIMNCLHPDGVELSPVWADFRDKLTEEIKERRRN